MNTSQFSELDRIKLKIKALSEKTVENGATEQEAMSAMAGVGRLLSQYNLTMSEIDVRTSSFKQIALDVGDRQMHPVSFTVMSLARLIDGKVWSSRRNGGCKTVFFGQEQDLELVEYLFKVIKAAIDTETVAFKKNDYYKSLPRFSKRTATSSFQKGMASHISIRLKNIKAENDAALKSAAALKKTGTDLLVLKKQLTEQEFEKIGIRLHSAPIKYTAKNAQAYYAGGTAGGRVNLSRPLKNGGGTVSGYLST